MRTRFSLFAYLCVTLVVSTGLCVAQEIYATLIGTVTDPSGAVVPNATGRPQQRNQSDSDCDPTERNFTVTNLPAGTYTVTFKSAGSGRYGY